MKRSKPMSRGKGFRMRDYQKATESEVEIPVTPECEKVPHLKPLVRGVYGPAQLTARPREKKPIRSEEYRRLVASLPCFHCGLQGSSQAAHPNSGKGRGVKESDLSCFPLCADRPGIKGCHSRFDQYELVAKGDPMREFEAKAKSWTQTLIRTRT